MIPETFERLKNSDRAVSPVIGVILMVAITVILAAVIAAFVLGFGADTEAPPQASLDMDVDAGTDNVTIEHLSGESINHENLRLGGDVSVDNLTTVGLDGELQGGDIVELNLTDESISVSEGDAVNLVWDSGDESTTLASGEA